MVAATEPARSPDTGPRLVTPAIAPILVINCPPTATQLAVEVRSCAKATEARRTRLLGTSARSDTATKPKARVVNLSSSMTVSLSRGRRMATHQCDFARPARLDRASRRWDFLADGCWHQCTAYKFG